MTNKIKKKGSAIVNDAAARLGSGIDHLGVHVWGNNRYNLATPDAIDTDPPSSSSSTSTSSLPALVKKPRYLPSLSGQAFRDLALHETYACAVTTSGDLLQWGDGYSPTSISSGPEISLRGQDIVQLALTPEKIYARTKGGKVIVLPANKIAQTDTSSDASLGPLPSIGWYWKILGYKDPRVHFKVMDLKAYSSDSKDAALVSSPLEKIVDIQAGRSHLLALTDKGKVLGAAVDSAANEIGQLGGSKMMAGVSSSSTLSDDTLSPITRDSAITYDLSLRPIPALRRLKVTQICTGDRHSLALTSEGRVLGWGNNAYGQLAMGQSYSFPTIPTPTECSVTALYPKSARVSVKSIEAGGDTTYFVMDREDVRSSLLEEERSLTTSQPGQSSLGTATRGNVGRKKTFAGDRDEERRMYTDLLAVGNGMYGAIGNGQWNSTGQPVRVKTVSGNQECKSFE